jgi:hypothetical protein
MNIKQVSIIAGVLLILAIPSGFWPYGYYVLLRWIITGSALLLAYSFYESRITHWALVFSGVAFLFNPILPIYLDKQTWVIIDLIIAITFFVSSGAIENTKQK